LSEPQVVFEREVPRNSYEFLPFHLDVTKRLLLRDGERIGIPSKALDVLITLLQHYPETVTNKIFKAEVWSDAALTSRTLQQQIWTVRQALGDKGEAYIKNAPRLGYRFSGPLAVAQNISQPSERSTDSQLNLASEEAAGSEPELPTEAPVPLVSDERVDGPEELSQRSSKTVLRILAAVTAVVILVLYGIGLLNNSRKQHESDTPRKRVVTLVAGREGQEVDSTIRFIKVGALPSSVVLRPGSDELYVSETRNQSVSVIDLKSERVKCTLAVGHEPAVLAASPDGTKVYVSQQGGGISVIDTATKQARPFGTLTDPVSDMVVTHDGSKAYLALGYLGIGKLDLRSGLLVIISKLKLAQAVALTPDERRLYISYQGGGPGGTYGHDAIGYFDTSSDRFMGALTGFANVGQCLTAIPDSSQVWENGEDACDSPQYNHIGCPAVPAGLLNIIDTRRNRLEQSVAMQGTRLECVTFAPEDRLALVATTDQLLFMEPSTLRILRTVPVHSSGNIAFSRDGDLAYAPLPVRGEVAIIPMRFHVRAFKVNPSVPSAETVTVGIISTPTFNAMSIDPETLRLGDQEVRKSSKGFLVSRAE
jgi:DNA-binding winged helix-turn-helix (wHTH) protein/DNA-binding beta-propeller fold protein YncE